MQSYILLYLLFSRNEKCKENHPSNIWKNEICYILAKRLSDRQEIIKTIRMTQNHFQEEMERITLGGGETEWSI